MHVSHFVIVSTARKQARVVHPTRQQNLFLTNPYLKLHLIRFNMIFVSHKIDKNVTAEITDLRFFVESSFCFNDDPNEVKYAPIVVEHYTNRDSPKEQSPPLYEVLSYTRLMWSGNGHFMRKVVCTTCRDITFYK